MSLQTQSTSNKSFTLSQRLTIIQQLIEELGPQNSLKVIINDDPMIANQSVTQQGNTVYTYQLVGSKSLRKTQNNNLLQKLEIMEKNQSQNKNSAKIKDQALISTSYQEQQQKDQQQKDQSKATDDTQKAMFRYFTENVKCFRCKKVGHHDYACLDEYSCSLCLSSQHHSQKCPQKIVCFRCYSYGHMVNECKYKEDGPFCLNCKRKHFDKCGFLMKGTQQVKQMFVMDGLYFSEEIRCLKCFQYGHYNCQMNEGTNYLKRPYQAPNDRNQRKESREKYHNPSKKYKY